MSRLLASEWVKITTVRTFLWLLLFDLAFVLVTTIATVANSDDIQSAQDARGTAQIASLALVLALVAAILVVAGESTHGTITQTLLVTPKRERVLAAKAVVGALLALALVAVAEVLVLAILVPGASLDVHDAGLVFAGTLIAAPIVGLFGIGLGTIITGQGTAIAASLVWLLVGEGLFPVISSSAAPYTPGRAIAALVSGDADGNDRSYLLGVAAGGVVSAIWAVVFLTVALVLLLRRDV